jgi:hypothetical protein
LKTTVADATTLELSGAPLKLRIKALGVAAAQLAAAAVTAGKIAAGGVSTTAELADAIVSTAKVIDAAITTAKIADANVTAAKIAHDNSRTKAIFTLNLNSWTPPTVTVFKVGEAAVAAADGVPMPRAGYVTAYATVDGSGNVRAVPIAYGTAGMGFAAGDKLGMQTGGAAGSQSVGVYKNGSLIGADGSPSTRTGPLVGMIEVEFT